MAFRYRELVLSELSRHGLKPGGQTPPEFAREFVNDLYLYEIRALRKRMRAGLIPKGDYAKLVEELRKRYPILSLPIAVWTEPD
ncbi:MAG TPA: hypothetical protein VJZ26_00020 [Blastocatellia bacterium]|nr:hypothetical protein [Blastocatellia bacterium]